MRTDERDTPPVHRERRQQQPCEDQRRVEASQHVGREACDESGARQASRDRPCLQGTERSHPTLRAVARVPRIVRGFPQASGAAIRTVTRMIDVVLPVLDEAEAIPRVLAAMPVGFSPIVVDNGSTDGSASIAAATRRARRHRTGARLRRRVSRRPAGGDDGPRLLHGLRRDARPCGSSAASWRPSRRGRADLVLACAGTRIAVPGPRTRVSRIERSRGSSVAARECVSATSGRCGRRAAPRSSTSTSAIGASGTRSRWCCAPAARAVADHRDRGRLPRPNGGPFEGHRHGLGHRSHLAATCLRWRLAHDRRRDIARDRQNASTGPGENAPVSAVHSGRGGRDRGGRAGRHTASSADNSRGRSRPRARRNSGNLGSARHRCRLAERWRVRPPSRGRVRARPRTSAAHRDGHAAGHTRAAVPLHARLVPARYRGRARTRAGRRMVGDRLAPARLRASSSASR